MKHGYTLIELVIAIAIMGLLVGASIAGFNTLNKRQTVLNSGKEVMSIMRTAQQRAASGTKPAGCTQLYGYTVKATINTSVYSLSSVCSNATTVIRNYQLPSSVTFVSTFNTQFNVQTGGASGTTGDISMKSTYFTYTMTIGSAGDITEKVLQ